MNSEHAQSQKQQGVKPKSAVNLWICKKRGLFYVCQVKRKQGTHVGQVKKLLCGVILCGHNIKKRKGGLGISDLILLFLNMSKK